MHDTLLAQIDATRAARHARLFDFLAIPSVSAQPDHAGDCAAAADWAAANLRASGFEARVCATPGHPVVLAHHAGTAGPAAPHLLYYGHYDVQPAEPFELWTSPPFAPVMVEGRNGPRIVARGAVDDKGQVAMWLDAFRAWHETAGGPPCRITVVLEGEEEVGSKNLAAFLAAHRAALAADVAIVSDTNMWRVDVPAVTTRLRGLVYTQLNVRAASRDLHSGLYGGAALNPINALAHILGGLHGADGSVQLAGFYEGVAPVPPPVAAQWSALDFDEAAFLGEIGLAQPAGEQGVPALQRLWARPTADINGIWGGYQGPGPKTVIAAEAGAKISFRLVPGQDPARVAAGFRQFVQNRAPAGVTAEVEVFSAEPAIEVPTENRFVALAQQALAAEYGRPAVLIGSGGSIPVVASLKHLLGLDTLLMGFGLDDDQIHSPNEKFEVACLEHGTRAHARLLGLIAA